jgi:serine protease Do
MVLAMSWPARLVIAGVMAACGSPMVAAQPAAPGPPRVRLIGVPAGSRTSYLGVNLAEIDAGRAKTLKLKEVSGVEITRVEEESPAAEAGLKVGDVVLAYNGEKVEGMEQFARLVRETPVGREVKLLISRNGAQQNLTAKIGSRPAPFGMPLPRIETPPTPPIPDMPRSIMMWRTTLLGIEGETLHGQLADYFGVKRGVLVRSVMQDTPAAKAGIKAGDVIVKVGDSSVGSPSEITSVLRRIQGRQSVPIVLVRDHKEMTVNAEVDRDRSDWDDFFERAKPVLGRPVKL